MIEQYRSEVLIAFRNRLHCSCHTGSPVIERVSSTRSNGDVLIGRSLMIDTLRPGNLTRMICLLEDHGHIGISLCNATRPRKPYP
jgi:hypothetical protein